LLGGAATGRKDILDVLDFRASRALNGEKIAHLSTFNANAGAMGRLWHTSSNQWRGTNNSFPPTSPIFGPKMDGGYGAWNEPARAGEEQAARIAPTN